MAIDFNNRNVSKINLTKNISSLLFDFTLDIKHVLKRYESAHVLS
jgi:hypothetical protein